jgi:putative ABC transport system permease protein
MSVVGRGIRNAFRNATRTVSIAAILGLAIALALVMLIAHRAVGEKVSTTLSSVGNTVTIGPPGYSAGGPLGNFLTSAELAPIEHLPGVTGVNESLNSTVQASNLPPVSERVTGSPGRVARVGGKGGSSPVKQGTTSLKYPGTLAFAAQGLSCQPGPCAPKVSYYTIYLSGSTEPLAAVNIGASALTIVSGQAISGTSSAYDAMISTQMAQKNELHVGSTFTAYGKILTVDAIFSSDSQQGADTVITSLPVLQHLMGDTDGPVFSTVVTAASLTDLSTVTSEIERVLGSRASVVSYLTDAEQAVNALNGVQSIALDSLIGAVAAAAVILFFVMVMIVRERKREIGILKAIGAPDGRVMAQFAVEAVAFTVLGLVVGFVIGIIAASPVTSSLVSHSGVSQDTGARGLFGAGNPALTSLTAINAQAGWTVIIEGLTAGVIVAVVASVAAAWMISRVRPAEVLRSV